MSRFLDKAGAVALRILPAPVRARISGGAGKRLVRFAPAAVLAVGATQLTYVIAAGPAHLTARVTGALGWLAGALVSYLVSRWAWERKGKPDLLRETLPFWAISITVGIILTEASKIGFGVATSMGLRRSSASFVAVAEGFYFAANCVTFVIRFLIFHYVLFTDRRAPGPVDAESITPVPVGTTPAVGATPADEQEGTPQA